MIGAFVNSINVDNRKLRGGPSEGERRKARPRDAGDFYSLHVELQYSLISCGTYTTVSVIRSVQTARGDHE